MKWQIKQLVVINKMEKKIKLFLQFKLKNSICKYYTAIFLAIIELLLLYILDNQKMNFFYNIFNIVNVHRYIIS